MNDIWTQIVITLVGLAFSSALAVITRFLVPWLKSKIALIKDEKMRAALNLLLEQSFRTIEVITLSVEQTLVADYKRKGQWDAETQKTVLNFAIEEVKRSFNEDQIKQILAQTDLSLEDWIRVRIEAAIQSWK